MVLCSYSLAWNIVKIYNILYIGESAQSAVWQMAHTEKKEKEKKTIADTAQSIFLCSTVLLTHVWQAHQSCFLWHIRGQGDGEKEMRRLAYSLKSFMVKNPINKDQSGQQFQEELERLPIFCLSASSEWIFICTAWF